MQDRDELLRLVRLGHSCLSISTFEEDYALGLLRDIATVLNRNLWVWSVSGGLQNGLLAASPSVADSEDPAVGLTRLGELDGQPLCVTLDLAPHLRQERALRVLRNVLHRFEQTGGQLVLIDYADDLPAVIAQQATRYAISLPDERELEQIVRDTLRRIHHESPIVVDMTRRNLRTIIKNLRGLTRRQAERIIADTVTIDRRFDEHDINAVLAAKRQALHKAGLLEYVETPVSLEQIGGLRRLKQWLALRQNDLDEQARGFGLCPPRGVLMLGVQGAGKSLCAKAIATAWQRPLLRMDVGALYDRYIGESERRLRESLQQAERMAPIVLWIDEIEKAFASAASRNIDGGLSQRMFGSLLTWMQEHTAAVFLVATANDIEALPPELLRKGRFDEIFFLDLPTRAERVEIFSVHLTKRNRLPQDYDLERLAQESEGYVGAEIEQAVIDSMYVGFNAGREFVTEDISEALRRQVPLSVSQREIITALRNWLREGRAQSASFTEAHEAERQFVPLQINQPGQGSA
jgi:ATP-dependent 26S proteasome regulatory subunit